MSASTLPTGPAALVKAMTDGWRHHVSHAAGLLDVTRRSEETDGNGKRRNVVERLVVDSILVQACHPDGRAVVTLWHREQGATTPTGKAKGYAMTLAYRGRHNGVRCACPDRAHLGEHVPAALNVGEVKAYVGGPDPAAALDAVEQVRAKVAAATAKRAATVAAKRADDDTESEAA